VRECDAFLAGTMAVEASRRGQSPLHWHWLNLLAHGSEEQVRALAGERLPAEPTTLHEAKWYAALSFLAGQMLDVVGAGGLTLAELQRSVLVPLELELVLDTGAKEPSAPGTLVLRVLERLNAASQLRER